MSEAETTIAETSTRDFRSDDLRHPTLYINRELSLLEFNKRVLALAMDESIPLLERLKFLCISCTNLDEFFEVRVATIRKLAQHNAPAPGPDGMTPEQTLRNIRTQTKVLVENQYRYFNEVLQPALAKTGIHFVPREKWTPRQKHWLHEYFKGELLPVLSPLGLDPVHPFPRILNKSLNFAVELQGKDAFGREGEMALVRAPRSLPRMIRIPRAHAQGPYDFVFLSSVLHEFMAELFPGMQVTGCHQFRVTRNSELFVDEEAIEDLARALQGELLERGFAEGVRLEITRECPDYVAEFLSLKFGLSLQDVYRCDGPVNLNRLQQVYDVVQRSDLKYPGFKAAVAPALLPGAQLFEAIARQDFILHHPYDSFSTVVELLQQAAYDPTVLAVKQTLYRTGTDSVLVNLLIEAARAGKDVTVVVELRARFDEAANIGLATRLQEAGVQVVYGVVGHKTHAKMLLIVRREAGSLRRYVHLGTGNYHPGTAKGYTDIGLLSANDEVGHDVHHIFQQLSGLGKVMKMNCLLHSPFTLAKKLIKKIRRETANAAAGKPAKIYAKLNSLTDPRIIRTLYLASQAGVEIKLLVRGICCLRPGIAGISENIQVISILGRFLEHSRVFYFYNDENPELYCSSADWMERNLYHRVEVAFPILQPDLKQQVYTETFAEALKPNIQAWLLDSEGHYSNRSESHEGVLKHLQSKLIKRAQKA